MTETYRAPKLGADSPNDYVYLQLYLLFCAVCIHRYARLCVKAITVTNVSSC